MSTAEPIVSTDTRGPSPANLTTFVDYRKAVRELLMDLQTLAKHAGTLEMSALAAQISQVLARLEADKFSVAIVGEFKRGKSTFINALLGAEVLPTDVLPCSATLNRVTYGLQKRAVLEYRDGRDEEIAFDRLAEHVTKLTDESEELAKSIRKATVFFPSPYCQNNVDVIDTPGLNDDDAMTGVTIEVLPEVDAAIMVIRAQSPFGEYERRFLETRLLSSDLGRVLFVVNGIDQLNSESDAERVVEAVRKRITSNVLDRAKQQFGQDSPEYELYVRKIGKPKVFGISAYEAVEGKVHNDHARLERSRFPVFEKELQRFLTEQRGAVTLEVPIHRALTSAAELLSALATHASALAMKAEEFERAVAESQTEIADLRSRQAEHLVALTKAEDLLGAQVGALAASFVVDFRDAVLGAIDDAEISSRDISGKDAKRVFDKQLAGAIERVSAQVVDRYSQKLEIVVGAVLVKEAERMQGFDAAIRGLMGRIEGRFNGIAEANGDGSTGGEAAAALLGAVFGMGVWSGYRSAGWKGAGVGAATSFGVAMAGGVAAALIGISITFPVILAVGVASFFSGGWVSDKLFAASKIADYRQKLREEADARMKRETPEPVVREQFQAKAAQAMATFRKRIEDEADAVLSDANATLAKLRVEYAQGRTQTENEIQTATKVRQEVMLIAERAAAVGRQLGRLAQEAIT